MARQALDTSHPSSVDLYLLSLGMSYETAREQPPHLRVALHNLLLNRRIGWPAYEKERHDHYLANRDHRKRALEIDELYPTLLSNKLSGDARRGQLQDFQLKASTIEAIMKYA